jgi:hypothetical protein
MSETKKPIVPKVIDFLLLSDSESIDKREGIELVEVYPGRWDININDRPNNKRVRFTEISYFYDDTLHVSSNTSRGYLSGENLSKNLTQECNELRAILKKRKYCNTCINKIIEYLMKAVELNQQYIKRKVYNV